MMDDPEPRPPWTLEMVLQLASLAVVVGLACWLAYEVVRLALRWE
jgi:hypothetical protein